MTNKQQLDLAESFLYRSSVEQKSLPALIDRLFAAGVREVKAHMLLLEEPLNLSVRRSSFRPGHQLDVLAVSPTSVSGMLSGKFGRNRSREASGIFIAVQHPEHPLVWTVVTHSGSDFELHPLESFISSLRPRCTRPIFQTEQIRNLIAGIDQLPSTRNLRVTQIGSRAKIRSEGASKSLESDRRWTDLSITEAFGELRSEGHWATDASAKFTSAAVQNAGIKITRFGIFTFRKIAGEVFSRCISKAALMARERYEFLHGRARSKATNFIMRPFNVEFGIPVFDSSFQVKKLHDALKKLPAATCTILHSNPYFHAIVVDYYDGSNYEVLIINKSHLTVIPQGRATVGALQRFCAAVFFGFREGELREVSNG